MNGQDSRHGAVLDEKGVSDECWAGFSEGNAATVVVADISALMVILQREKQGEDVSHVCI